MCLIVVFSAKLSSTMTNDEFIVEFGMSYDDARKVIEQMSDKTNNKWDALIDYYCSTKNYKPMDFVKLHSKKLRTKIMLKGLGYNVGL